MSRLRFSIAQLMAIILYAGFAFAALRNANAIWASATFSVAVVLVSVACAGAYTRKGTDRTSWTGFAAAGGIRLVVWLLSTDTINGPPRPLLYLLRAYIDYSGPYYLYIQVCNSLDIILLGMVGAAIGHFVAAKEDFGNALIGGAHR